MGQNLIIPAFSSEAEDAAWHDAHRKELEKEMKRRIKEGTTLSLAQALKRAKRKPLRRVTIQLAPEEINAARKLAAHQGIGYQAYIKFLLSETLRQRMRNPARSRRK